MCYLRRRQGWPLLQRTTLTASHPGPGKGSSRVSWLFQGDPVGGISCTLIFFLCKYLQGMSSPISSFRELKELVDEVEKSPHPVVAVI